MSHAANTRLVRHTHIALTLMLITSPLVLWGTYKGLRNLNDDVIAWTSPHLPARADLNWFTKHFGQQNAILVSWSGAKLNDAKLERFAEAFRDQIQNDEAYADLFADVFTGSDVYLELTSGPSGFSHRQAIERMKGMFVGSDGSSSLVVVVVSENAGRNARDVLRMIGETAEKSCGVDSRNLHMAGYLVETATLDNEALQTLYWLSIPSALIVILIAWPCLRGFRLSLLVWISAAYCQCFSLAIVYYFSGEINGMMTILPILILVIFVSSAVHMVNYYQNALETLGPVKAPRQAFAVGWFPCTLAVVTSAVGMGSLAFSDMPAVRDFGIYAAASTLSTLAIMLLVMPGGMHLLNNSGKSDDSRGQRRAIMSSNSRAWDFLARHVQRHSWLILIVCFILAALAFRGLAWIRGSMQLTDMQRKNSRIVQDHLWFQKTIGPLMPVEMVLVLDKQSKMSMIEKLELVGRVEDAARSMPAQVSTTSLTAFIPNVPSPGGIRGTARRSIFNRRLRKQKSRLAADSPYYADTDENELWRITARLDGFQGQRYEDMLADFKRTVEPVVDAARQQHGEKIAVVYTGALPILAESHPTLIHDLMLSFGLSLLTIGVILVFGLRSIRLGLMSIVPNVFPILLVFGGLGWLGQSVDVGTMMTAAVGLGIAVDGTVHYLTWFVRGTHDGLARQAAILNAYRHSAPAMLRTTAICGAGLAVFGLSSFLPAARFGWIVCVLLLTALLADLILLPALLAGRLGKFVFPDNDKAFVGSDNTVV